MTDIMRLDGKRVNLDIPQKSTSKKSRPSKAVREKELMKLMNSMNAAKGKKMSITMAQKKLGFELSPKEMEMMLKFLKDDPQSIGKGGTDQEYFKQTKKKTKKKTATAAKGGMMKKKSYAKGGAMKKKGYAMGGMMEERKVNPTTGMMMKKGGMVDMRKSGMFSKGGLTKKRPRGK